MNKVKQLIGEYLGTTRIMQLATAIIPEEKEQRPSPLEARLRRTSDDKKRSFVSLPQPWCCTVYYAYDDTWNFYWLSLPTRQHSREIAQNPKVAAAIAFSQEPPTNGVRGLSVEGVANVLNGGGEEMAARLYINQLKQEPTLLEDIRSGRNLHQFYCLKPTKFVLFDSVNFPNNPRQEYVTGLKYE